LAYWLKDRAREEGLMGFIKGLRSWALLMLGLIVMGCASGGIAPGSIHDEVVVADYRLGPGDQVRVRVFGEESLSGEFVISSNGAISYALVGDVPAQGKTVSELADAIKAVLQEGYVRQPIVSVEVMSYRPFYILGEIGASGSYPYTPGLTVMRAVATAGGFSYRADTSRVFIQHAGQPAETAYRLTGTTPVQPGDTIRIPERRF
jgi:polysaccharide export outer membrane protein